VGQVNIWRLALVVVIFGTSNLSATPCTIVSPATYCTNSASSPVTPSGGKFPVEVAWIAYTGTGYNQTLAGVPCSFNTALNCGLHYYLGTSGLTTINWHAYNPSTNGTPQAYVTSLMPSGVTMTLSGSNTSLYNTNGTLQSPALPYRVPDHYDATNTTQPTTYGYFMATSGGTGTSVTIQFGTVTKGSNGLATSCSYCITQLAFYWGSVDYWNHITFTDVNGYQTTFTGCDLPGFFQANSVCTTNSGIYPNGKSNTQSAMVDFQVFAGHYVWQSVTLHSDAPAFEFDNLAWAKLAAGAPLCTSVGTFVCSATGPVTAPPRPTPEPASMFLMGTGIAGIALLLRRKLRS
jgi:PEP-CTERM motif